MRHFPKDKHYPAFLRFNSKYPAPAHSLLAPLGGGSRAAVRVRLANFCRLLAKGRGSRPAVRVEG